MTAKSKIGSSFDRRRASPNTTALHMFSAEGPGFLARDARVYL